jgi:hypothetical protein
MLAIERKLDLSNAPCHGSGMTVEEFSVSGKLSLCTADRQV